MWAILLMILACLLTSCLSATREREANCLGATMMGTWQTEHDLTSAEEGWRTAQKARSERSTSSRDTSKLSVWFANNHAPPGIVGQVANRDVGANLQPSH